MKILLIDDDEPLRELTGLRLKAKGFQMLAAADGREGLEAARRDRPDLILLDIMMPEMDGFEVCRRLKQDPSTQEIPVFFFTARDAPGDKVEGLELGADDFISKPYDFGELLARIRARLRIRDLEGEMRRLLAKEREQNREIREINRLLEKANLRHMELQQALRQRDQILTEELKMAAMIQEGLIPQQFPEHLGIRCAGRFQPSREVGGDLYDVVDLDDGRVGVMIADVSGHGIAAAFLMAMTKIAFRTVVREIPEPDRLLERLNSLLHRYFSQGHFLTMFYGVLRPASGQLAYATAGHPPPFLVGAQEAGPLKGNGMLLGASSEAVYEARTVDLWPGHRLFLYTDGVTEHTTPQGAVFGEDRLLEALRERQDRAIGEQIALLFSRLYEFGGGGPFRDDAAVLGVEVSK